MGTSSSYGGHKDNRGLLPDDYNDSNDNDLADPNISWKSVKTEFSKYINGNNGSDIKHTTRNYVRVSGGSQALVSKSANGINGAINIARVFNSIKENGIKWTLKNIGIKYEGKSIKEIYSILVNYIVRDSNSKDDGVARKAAIEALSTMYQLVEDDNLDLESLNYISKELMDTVFCSYVESYIWGKILNDLEICFEKHSYDVDTTITIEEDMKLYISNLVSATFNSKGMREKIFGGKSIKAGVELLYKRCYEGMEEISK